MNELGIFTAALGIAFGVGTIWYMKAQYGNVYKNIERNIDRNYASRCDIKEQINDMMVFGYITPAEAKLLHQKMDDAS